MSDRRLNLLAPIAGFCVVVAFGVGVIATAAYNSTNTSSTDAAPAAAVAEGAATTLEVALGDLYVKPAALEAPAGALEIRVHNEGQAQHNFAIEGVGKTPMLDPGDSHTLEVDSIAPGEYATLCEVSGHADGGMKGTLTVTDGADAATAAADEGADMSPQEMVAHDAEVTGSFPAETKGAGNKVLKPKIKPDGTKVFELTAEAIEWETEPGKVVEAYAYNGQVPGPQIHAQLGDKVEIVLHNELPEATTVHFHGMEVPAKMDGVPVISQDAVMPGESFTYRFTVRNSGSHMYHSHFNAQKQVPMGLLGALIVADDEDPAVDTDYTMVLNDGPLGFTLNGKGFPATEPIVAKKGDLIRVRYMNEGLQIHPMHLHGIPQTVIAKDGFFLDSPYRSDTVLVAPGERIDVLIRADALGAWAYHCHILNHAEGPTGMFGMVTALVVQ